MDFAQSVPSHERATPNASRTLFNCRHELTFCVCNRVQWVIGRACWAPVALPSLKATPRPGASCSAFCRFFLQLHGILIVLRLNIAALGLPSIAYPGSVVRPSCAVFLLAIASALSMITGVCRRITTLYCVCKLTSHEHCFGHL
jgi:hypothetical protein